MCYATTLALAVFEFAVQVSQGVGTGCRTPCRHHPPGTLTCPGDDIVVGWIRRPRMLRPVVPSLPLTGMATQAREELPTRDPTVAGIEDAGSVDVVAFLL